VFVAVRHGLSLDVEERDEDDDCRDDHHALLAIVTIICSIDFKLIAFSSRAVVAGGLEVD
jgi:hypothetical protein